jgi:hypothetical protein
MLPDPNGPAIAPRRFEIAWFARYWPWLFLAAMFLLAVGYLGCWPIRAGDTDLWYHLNAGRYILAHHHLPRDNFFSFLTPPRLYNDYYWLFQALVFLIYSGSGYPGLIVLRTMFFAAALLAIARLLTGKQARPSGYCCVLFSLYAVFLSQRYTLVRPHITSYFFIPLFLGVLESRGRWVMALPVLAALWGNLHGIECPIVCLIMGSYIAEYFLQPRGEFSAGERQRFLISAGLATVAVFLTPVGRKLFEIPWIPVEYIQRMIGEDAIPRFVDLISLDIVGGAPTVQTCFRLLLATGVLAATAAVARRRVRVSHFLLFAAGAYLLSRGARFAYECALLMLPLLAANPPFEKEAAGRVFSKPVAAVLLAALAAASALGLGQVFAHRPRYPAIPSRHATFPRGSARSLIASARAARSGTRPDPAAICSGCSIRAILSPPTCRPPIFSAIMTFT